VTHFDTLQHYKAGDWAQLANDMASVYQVSFHHHRHHQLLLLLLLLSKCALMMIADRFLVSSLI
jgi:hypothetical protein